MKTFMAEDFELYLYRSHGGKKKASRTKHSSYLCIITQDSEIRLSDYLKNVLVA